MKRVDFFWGWRQSLRHHDWNEFVDARCGRLLSEVERFVDLERLAKNHHCVDVSVLHALKKYKNAVEPFKNEQHR